MTSTPPPHLLDANVVIALTVAEHEHHATASRWAAAAGVLALCPIVEGALIRYLLRSGESRATACAVLAAVYDRAQVTFWHDAVSYVNVELGHVTGHRQVTDAYLASLAGHHGGRLATLDEGLAAELPDLVDLVG